MLKKIIKQAIAVGMMLSLLACSKKQDDISILAPEQLNKDIPVTELDNGIKIYNGYVCDTSEGNPQYFPYIENKKDGVLYVDDAFINSAQQKARIEMCAEFNKPAGCYIRDCARTNCSLLKTGGFSIPDFARTSETLAPEYYKHIDVYMHRRYLMFRLVNEGTSSTDIKLRDIDVQAISFVLYEDFFKDIPKLTIGIYAVSKDAMKKMFGDTFDNVYLGKNIYDKIDKDGYKDFELIKTQEISTTGVYYIDWKALDANDNYATYIFTIDFDRAHDFIESYCISGEFMYDIEDEKAYAEWKNANIDRFIIK